MLAYLLNLKSSIGPQKKKEVIYQLLCLKEVRKQIIARTETYRTRFEGTNNIFIIHGWLDIPQSDKGISLNQIIFKNRLYQSSIFLI